MNTEHTPTPWHVIERSHIDKVDFIIQTDQQSLDIAKLTFNRNSLIGIDEQRANAQFIVTACNSYEAREALVKELVEALDNLTYVISKSSDYGTIVSEACSVRSLLAKAKGEA